jgi:hypothetical protein
MADKKIIIGRKYIDLDTSYENVLEWAEEGHTMVFLSKPELFMELTPEQVKALPQRVKTSYRLALADFKTQTKSFTDPELEFLSASVEYGSPTEQLNVDQTGVKGKKIKWVRPEQIKDYGRRGWSVVKTDMDSQRGLRDGNYHMVGKKELILLEIPIKRYNENAAKRNERGAQMLEANAEEMKRSAREMNAIGSFETSEEDINIPLD